MCSYSVSVVHCTMHYVMVYSVSVVHCTMYYIMIYSVSVVHCTMDYVMIHSVSVVHCILYTVQWILPLYNDLYFVNYKYSALFVYYRNIKK